VYPRAKKTANKIPGKGGLRWYKNVGLGFKTPKEAIEGALNSCGAHAASQLGIQHVGQRDSG
jgi:hypothetical protein